MKDLENTLELDSFDDLDISQTLKAVNQALIEKGYNSINQIIGYILSGDSSYITSYKDARNMIKKFERDEILEEVMTYYLDRK